MNYLWAAYVVTWVVHIAYIVWLTVKFVEAGKEAQELLRESNRDQA